MLDWARISIGTKEEMETAIPVFMSVLASAPVQTASLDLRYLESLPNELS
jgi:hypothetical protein